MLYTNPDFVLGMTLCWCPDGRRKWSCLIASNSRNSERCYFLKMPPDAATCSDFLTMPSKILRGGAGTILTITTENISVYFA